MVAVFAFLLAVSTPAAADLKITFIGNAAVHLTDGAATLVTDFPYRPGAFGYMTYDISRVPTGGENTAVLITHAHADHFAPELFQGRSWKLYGPDHVARATPGGVALAPDKPVRHGAFEILALPTPHGDIPHNSYLVTWRGRRLYFSGDTESEANLLTMRNLDVAFVSPWVLSQTNKAGKKIDARKIVVYHHRSNQTKPPYPGSIVPRQGEQFALSAAAAPLKR